jgi:hypothetical protein
MLTGGPVLPWTAGAGSERIRWGSADAAVEAARHDAGRVPVTSAPRNTRSSPAVADAARQAVGGGASFSLMERLG